MLVYKPYRYRIYLFFFVIYETANILIQPFDLTDLDWSVELWLACHDEDEQNARLATQLWEENGFDVSEKFCSDLMALLGMRIYETLQHNDSRFCIGHENRYVRSSCAASIAAAVEHLPDSMPIVSQALREEYKNKVSFLPNAAHNL